MSVFELIMLIGFGFAWPMNIYRSVTTRTAKGKSLLFSIAIIIGYISGIIHKVLYSQDWVLILYVINLTMVLIDFGLVIRNRRLDRQRDAELAARLAAAEGGETA